MQTCMSISAADLRYNAQAVIDFVKTPVIAVIKCNGYGVTIEHAAKAWYDCGVRFFAVSEPDEVFALDKLGLDDIKVLLMTPVADTDTLQKLLKLGTILTVSSYEKAQFYANNAGEFEISAHLKIDTGMGRFGIRYNDFDELMKVYSAEKINFCGIFSHFAQSFEKEFKSTKTQFEKFNETLEFLNKNQIDVGTRHIANSCAALRFTETRLDAVRIGSALVGRLMVKTPLDLKKVGKIKARVVDVKTLQKGDTTGYAMIVKATKPTKCAVVAIGSRHGLGVVRKNDNHRFIDLLRNFYKALKEHKKPLSLYCNNTRYNVFGRIGNQFTLVDVTGSDVKSGDIFTADVNVLTIDDIVPRIIEN